MLSKIYIQAGGVILHSLKGNVYVQTGNIRDVL